MNKNWGSEWIAFLRAKGTAMGSSIVTGIFVWTVTPYIVRVFVPGDTGLGAFIGPPVSAMLGTLAVIQVYHWLDNDKNGE